MATRAVTGTSPGISVTDVESWNEGNSVLIGQRTAIIPLGLSCQPTTRLKDARQVAEGAFGEDFQYSSAFLNWLIIDPNRLPDLLRAYAHKPFEEGDVEPDGVLRIKNMRVWLMHDIGKTDRVFTVEETARIVAKYEHLRQKFYSTRSKEHRIFIISNGDPNLRQHHMWRENLLDLQFTSTALRRLEAALNEVFPTGRNSLVVAAGRDFTPQIDWAYHTVVLERPNEWWGDPAEWEQLIKDLPSVSLSPSLIQHAWRRRFPRKVEPTPSHRIFGGASPDLELVLGQASGSHIVVEAPTEGLAFCGPSIRLFAGTYECRVDFLPGTLRGSGRLSVTEGENEKKRTIWSVAVPDGSVVQPHQNAVMRFVLPKDTPYVGVELFCSPGFKATLTGIHLEKLD